MKKILNLFFIPVFMHASFLEKSYEQDGFLPKETLCIDSDHINSSLWSLNTRTMSNFEGFCQWTQVGLENAKDPYVFAIRFIDKAQLANLYPLDMHKISYYFLIPRFEGISPDKLSWQVLESSPTELTLEWILKAPVGQIPPQHVVTKAYLTEQGVHLVSMTRNNQTIDQEEKDKILKTFKDNIAIKNLDDASKLERALSQAKSKEDAFNLGSGFRQWHLIQSQEIASALVETQFLPADFSVLNNPTDFLRVKVGSKEAFKIEDISSLYAEIVKMYQDQFKAKFSINEIMSNEIEKSFSFSIAQASGHVNFIVRLVCQGDKWLEATMMTLSEMPLNLEQSAYWYEKLSNVSIK